MGAILHRYATECMRFWQH